MVWFYAQSYKPYTANFPILAVGALKVGGGGAHGCA